jgi:hypothetical protein
MCAALALAACSPDVVSSIKAPTAPNFAVAVNGRSDYIVLTSKGIPAGFADRVASLGGSLTYANDKAGFAAVAGLTADGAAQIGALGGVARIDADAAVALDAPIATAEADVSDAANPVINSQIQGPAFARFGGGTCA